MVQTIVKEKYERETLNLKNNLFETDYVFEVYGQTVDRSYEDRDVFFQFSEHGWLKGEDAIELGQLLIKHGTRALMANMINHQHILEMRRLSEFIKDGRVEKCILTVIEESPANHGNGFRAYQVKPVWQEGMIPEYFEDFTVETIQYFSPFEPEYLKELEFYGGNVEFVGYDRQKELDDFKKLCETHE